LVLARAALEALLLEQFPDAQITISDLTGTEDHYAVRIITERFHGLSPIARHRLVYTALRAAMHGDIHALALETYTPSETVTVKHRA
jgi:stress-induced morphogen